MASCYVEACEDAGKKNCDDVTDHRWCCCYSVEIFSTQVYCSMCLRPRHSLTEDFFCLYRNTNPEIRISSNSHSLSRLFCVWITKGLFPSSSKDPRRIELIEYESLFVGYKRKSWDTVKVVCSYFLSWWDNHVHDDGVNKHHTTHLIQKIMTTPLVWRTIKHVVWGSIIFTCIPVLHIMWT